ncbi:MAG: hypothetical protein JNL05_09985 [Flavobacteriales bacterium]|nr:hypothetical protein [Flavobacteriales bacterium]
MRTSDLLLALLLTCPATAQLQDPGFEQGNTHWQFTCPNDASFTGSNAPNGGSLCAQVTMVSSTQPDCYLVDGTLPFVYQPLPGVQNGDVVTLSFWHKSIPTPAAVIGDMQLLVVFGWWSPPTVGYDGNSACAFNWYSASDVWEARTISCTFSGVPPGATPAVFLGGQAVNQTNGTMLFDNASISVNATGVALSARAWLDGCYVQAQGLMRDDLRAAGLVPSLNPYGGSESVAPSVLAVSGPDAIVDWVRLELRTGDMNTPQTVAVRHALLQRDGDIVDTDGTSPVTFNTGPGNYHVALLHRNHLGVVTGNSVPLSATPTVVDLRSPSTLCHTRPAPNTDLPRRTVGSTRTLWAGNVIGDDRVRYTGASNDRDPVLVAIGGTVPTNTLSGQYRQEDVNLDGLVKYAGTGNDRDLILQTIGGLVPTAVRVEQVP